MFLVGISTNRLLLTKPKQKPKVVETFKIFFDSFEKVFETFKCFTDEKYRLGNNTEKNLIGETLLNITKPDPLFDNKSTELQDFVNDNSKESDRLMYADKDVERRYCEEEMKDLNNSMPPDYFDSKGTNEIFLLKFQRGI